MSTRVSGAFDVKVIPQPAEDAAPAVGRMLLDKRFHGELDAVSRGQMLASRTADNDSAVYVAIELVDGSLGGRRGSFVLHHAGTMTREGQQLSVRVAPSSGTGELSGLEGTMNIVIAAGGKHSYEFEYTLPDPVA